MLSDFKRILVFLGEKNAEIFRIPSQEQRRLVSKILRAANEIAYATKKPADHVRLSKTTYVRLGGHLPAGLKIEVIETSDDGFSVGNDDAEYGGFIK